MEKFKIFLKELKQKKGTPELKSAWIFLGLAGLLLIFNIFFLPPIIALINGFFYVGIVVFLLYNHLKISQNNIAIKIKNLEFQSIIENLDAGVIGYDPNFKIITFNKAAENIFNLNASEIIGQYVNPGFSKNPRYRRLAEVLFPSLAPIMKPISEANTWPQIVDITLEDPRQELRTILNRITDEKNNLIGFLKIIRDRTREKDILKSKSEFISVAAHQLRTPLSAINWTFETLITSTEDKEKLSIIKSGYEATQRVLKIVNDLLDISRIEEGKYGFNFENVNLNDFLTNILTQFQSIAKQYQVNLYFTPAKENIIVRIDPQKLGIALSNIIDNAIRYNVKNGEVKVLVEKLKDRPFVKIDISDTGVGIPPSEKEKVFKKFYRGSNIIEMEPNGSGLGLYITKNIIQQHGGQISFESIIDRGTTFQILLPTDFSLIPSKEEVKEEEFNL